MRRKQHSAALDVGEGAFDDDGRSLRSDRVHRRGRRRVLTSGSARRRRARWGPLPVWPQLFGSRRGEARGGLADRQQMAEGNERHQAARTALIRRIDEVAPRSRWPPSPSNRAGRDRRLRRAQRPVWAPGVRILGQTPHYSQAIAHFVDRRSRDRSPGLRGCRALPSPNRDTPSSQLGLPTVSEGDGDRCRCGRGVRGRLDNVWCGVPLRRRADAVRASVTV